MNESALAFLVTGALALAGTSHRGGRSSQFLEEREISDIIETFREDGGLVFGGGYCGISAILIQEVLLGGRGRLLGLVNKAHWNARPRRFVGHVVVEFEGVWWDAEGAHAENAQSLLSWGMLDIQDPDWELKGCPLTDEEAEEVSVVVVSKPQLRRLLHGDWDDSQVREELVDAKRLALRQRS